MPAPGAKYPGVWPPTACEAAAATAASLASPEGEATSAAALPVAGRRVGRPAVGWVSGCRVAATEDAGYLAKAMRADRAATPRPPKLLLRPLRANALSADIPTGWLPLLPVRATSPWPSRAFRLRRSDRTSVAAKAAADASGRVAGEVGVAEIAGAPLATLVVASEAEFADEFGAEVAVLRDDAPRAAPASAFLAGPKVAEEAAAFEPLAGAAAEVAVTVGVAKRAGAEVPAGHRCQPRAMSSTAATSAAKNCHNRWRTARCNHGLVQLRPPASARHRGGRAWARARRGRGGETRYQYRYQTT